MKKEEVSQADGAKRLGITPQAIGMWAVKPGAPVVNQKGGKRLLIWPDFPRWREAELERKARGDGRPTDIADAQKRKMVADAMLAEIAVAEKERTVVSVDVLDQVLGERCEALVAVIAAMSSVYQIDLERAGVDPKVAQQLLEQIAADLTQRLRTTADEDDDHDPDA